ncbi:hypothetical protein [Metaclostridioides mangenotii]|uniref:Uncharacterized protein n=1 Tax=Metaclostridioides mangenotii TaxID=1540 RepID=A0ABS4EBT8_9FIRM|nr:hypothetical protein [Clostridioides mangenotii]MBP1855401.1 hypothetical protein [Clostridioides mangenotii]
MAKVLAPNKQYTGLSASVGFVNGVGETEDKDLLKWFKAHGYEIEEIEEQKEPEAEQDKELEKEKEEENEPEPNVEVEDKPKGKDKGKGKNKE